ncbi:MAG: hypothetical protein KAQ98_00540 [Bacteriovoracaceae bacterium]|nr:hypothetical protein [Bacteriovoracaceae bacterium]
MSGFKWVFVLSILTIVINQSFAQNLFSERLRRIHCAKKSIFLEKGIFHNGGTKRLSKLKAIRHSFSRQTGHERIVFDFTTSEIPRIYGHLSSVNKKLHVDFFDTELFGNISSFGSSKYVDDVKFFPLSEEMLSVELNFKEKVTFDIFCLKSPGRLVIDIKQ